MNSVLVKNYINTVWENHVSIVQRIENLYELKYLVDTRDR